MLIPVRQEGGGFVFEGDGLGLGDEDAEQTPQGKRILILHQS